MSAEVDFLLDPTERMGMNAHHRLTLTISDADVPEGDLNLTRWYRGSWDVSYCGPVSAYFGFGARLTSQPNLMPETRRGLEGRLRTIAEAMPDLVRLTTRDGAASDFVIAGPNGEPTFNLMAPDALDQIGAWIAARHAADLDRILALFVLNQHPAVLRHMSAGRHFFLGCGPLSIVRANFAGGGGNCGFHGRGFTGLAMHLPLSDGSRLVSQNVAVQGHVISRVTFPDGATAILDPDVGHVILSADRTRLATIEEVQSEPWSLCTTAGPGDLARYLTFLPDEARHRPIVTESAFPGRFP